MTFRLFPLFSLKLLPRSTRICKQAASAACQYSTSVLEEDASQATPTTHPWRIVTAACVQRMPLVTREKSEIELRVEDLKDKLRSERSKLSDFELEERKNQQLKREREKRALEEDLEGEQASKDDGTDKFFELQESREADLTSFEPASRETEADRTNDMRSIQRKLDHVLYLLVKKGRKEHAWQMPQGGVEGSESLLEAAKRELSEECGSSLEVNFLSGAPSTHLSYRHSGWEGILGSKVFFLKANYIGGDIQLNKKELEDYMWVTKKEMKDYVSEDFYSTISPVLPEH